MFDMSSISKGFEEYNQKGDTKALVRVLQRAYPGWGTDEALYQLADDASHQEASMLGDQGWSNLVWHTTAVALLAKMVRQHGEMVFEDGDGTSTLTFSYNRVGKNYIVDGVENYSPHCETDLHNCFRVLVEEVSKLR